MRLNKEHQLINKELKIKNNNLAQTEEELRTKLEELQLKTDLLEKSEERYRMLFNNMTESFALHEIVTNESGEAIDFIYRDVNSVFLDRVNMEYDDLVGKSAKELFPGIELNWIERFGKVALNGKSDHFIDNFSTNGKSYETIVFCPQKGFFGAIFNDITERLNAEKKIIEEKERTNYIIEGTKAGTWDWDIKKNRFTINERWANIIGFTKQELDGLNYNRWIESLHKDDVILVSSTLGRVFSKEHDYYDVEFRQQHKNGDYIWVHARGDIMERAANGQPLRMCGTHIDINSRKLTELKVIESEQRFKTIFNKSRTVMLLVNPKNMKIEDANDSALNFYGYSKDEMQNLYLSDINKMEVEALKNMVRLSKTEKKKSFSTKHTLKSGETRNIEAYTSPIKVNNKELIHAILIDTTKAVENEYKLRQINQRFIGLENIIHFKASSINDLLDFTLKQLIDYTQSDTGVVYHYHENKNLFLLNNFSKDVSLSMDYNNENPHENLDCLSKAVKIKETVIINDPHTKYPFFTHKKGSTDSKYYKSITIPVIDNEKVVALFWLGSKTTTYTKFHAEQVMLLLETAWILVGRQRHLDKKTNK
ncbi:PAS domain S-box protein [Plebeiibacterium marinum]|uniref:histidine kinase n=1 Tax=Plebeiibacterium marinum TaxID=2992111 RepID=A0AAE3SK94_9BACT|nr:PAS domain S-box protein [Plebeiobacterium marinum]MCW3805225.1 PAS domain S-box protein [Plebeiobacterium marinum]